MANPVVPQWPKFLALGGAIGAAAAAALQLAAVDGPWGTAGLGAALVAALGAALTRSGDAAPASSVPAANRTGSATPPAANRDHVATLRAELEQHKKLERDLTMAKHAAEAAMMSKGEFLATMSHEIRTPLNGIIPLLDLLLSSPMPPDQREHVQVAFGSAKQLLRIVDDILDYSKLEANKLELESVGLNLKDVLEGVIRLMEKAADGKGLRLSLALDPQVRLAVRGDAVRLRQVLTNLISNAIKFTERGEVSLAVSKRGETRTQHDLRFEVKDTGVGISADAATKLFRPFSQADTSTTRNFGGTGLGLVICKRIVDLMGGEIGVDSTPGRGSTFWFQIPMLKAVGDIGTRKRDVHGARILFVTANAAQQRRFAQALPSWGALAMHASNTQEAMAKLRAAAGRSGSWAFDLLLVDGGSIPSTVLALHRGVSREHALEDLRMIFLRGEDDLPAEIVETDRVRIVSREAGDGELRTQVARLLEQEVRPVVTAVADTAAAPALRSGGLAPDAPIRGHVLLVEDNPVNRQVAQRLLTLAGLTLDCAENGKEALDRIASTRYDAVLMDCQMPIMDGYSATRQLRTNEAVSLGPRLAVIAMTANAMVGDREKCLASGMDDYLSKPLNRALLEDTLRRWLPAVPVGQPSASSIRAAESTAAPMAATPSGPIDDALRALSADDLIAAIPPGITRHAAPPRVPAAPPAAPAPIAASVSQGSDAPTQPMPRPTIREIVQARAAAAPASPAPMPARPIPPAVARPAVPRQTAPRPPVAVPAANADPVLSREIVEDLRELMGEEFLSLVRVFLEDAPQAVFKLETAAANADMAALVGPAHSLKSTSANLGALALSDLARSIEHGARQKSLADPNAQVAALGREFHRVQAALRGFLG